MVAGVERDVMADVSVVLRWDRSRDVRVKWPTVWLALGCGAGEGATAFAGLVGCVGADGPRAGIVRPGGPRTGSMFPVL